MFYYSLCIQHIAALQMASVPSYRGVLKQVSDGLDPEDIENITYSLGFKPAKRASIKNGVQLLQEMENQDLISEEDLSQLKQLLDEHDKKKLGKIVGRYMDKNSRKADEEEATAGSQKVDHTGEDISWCRELQSKSNLQFYHVNIEQAFNNSYDTNMYNIFKRKFKMLVYFQ